MTGVQLYLPYVNKIIPDYSMIYAQLSFLILIRIMILTTLMMLCGVKVLTMVLILECGIILMVLKYLYLLEHLLMDQVHYLVKDLMDRLH